MEQVVPESVGLSAGRLDRINQLMRSYVDGGHAAGIVSLVARHGKVAYFDKYGYQDLASQTPIQLDTIFRIYSMTKPITSVAIMMLIEQGKLRLTDPLSKYVPAFKNLKVYSPDGNHPDAESEPTIHQLLTHTSGLSYGNFGNPDLLPPLYRDSDIMRSRRGKQGADFMQNLAELPLFYQPGTKWSYSLATDVLGQIVEHISGQSLGAFFDEHIFGPLGMVDTSFRVPDEKAGRFATLYGEMRDGSFGLIPPEHSGNFLEDRLHSGGGGLVSTAVDFIRFAQMLANKGEYEGVRFLGRKTVEYMATNHLPMSMLPIRMGAELMPGIGFGLGVRVVVDPTQTGSLCSAGNFGWGGWASTNFWVDWQESLVGMVLTQFIPINKYPLREDFRNAVYQSMID